MKFQFKITTWESVTVPEEHEEMILNKIKSGEIESSSDIFDELAELGDMNVECEKILEVDEQMTVLENQGFSTIEVLDNRGITIYGNGE